MQQAARESESTWYAGPRFRRTALAILCTAICIEGYYAVFRRDGDVLCHVDFGRHFLAGQPYASPGNYYPLGRVMFDVLFTLGDYRLTRGVFYCLAIGALICCFRIWERVASAGEQGYRRLSRPQ